MSVDAIEPPSDAPHAALPEDALLVDWIRSAVAAALSPARLQYVPLDECARTAMLGAVRGTQFLGRSPRTARRIVTLTAEATIDRVLEHLTAEGAAPDAARLVLRDALRGTVDGAIDAAGECLLRRRARTAELVVMGTLRAARAAAQGRRTGGLERLLAPLLEELNDSSGRVQPPDPRDGGSASAPGAGVAEPSS